MLEALPDGQPDYAPDAKSMGALKLAYHTVASVKWFLDSIVAGSFAGPGAPMPDSIKTGADIAAWAKANVPASVAAAKALPAAQWAQSLDFFGMMQAPACTYVTLALNHSIHHRGQLSAYLRPMGGKVPGIYGPSADSQ